MAIHIIISDIHVGQVQMTDVDIGRYLQPLLVLSLMVFVFLVFRAGLSVLMSVMVEILQRRIFVRCKKDCPGIPNRYLFESQR